MPRTNKPNKDSSITLRVDAKLKEEFLKLCEDQGTNITEQFTAFMRLSLQQGQSVTESDTTAERLQKLTTTVEQLQANMTVLNEELAKHKQSINNNHNIGKANYQNARRVYQWLNGKERTPNRKSPMPRQLSIPYLEPNEFIRP